jgi:hypothetical protein
MAAWASTGLNGLDEILCNLKKGCNVVWRLDIVRVYHSFVVPYATKALQDK